MSGMWVLEFHKIKDGTWFVWCRGSLEECLEDALELKAGLHGWGNSYDGARLGYAREDFPVKGTVYEGNIAAPRSCDLHEDCGAAEAEARHRFHDTHGAHSWKRDDARQVWQCEICPALVTEEELHRIKQVAVRGPSGEPNSTEELVTLAWAFKVAAGQT